VARPAIAYRLVARLSMPFWWLYRLDVQGKERLPEGGFVLSANHVSSFDPWPLGLPLYPRWLRFMAKSELFWWPLGKFVSGAGAFKVRRGQADREAIETAVALVKQGEIVVMFPEGTRQKKGLRKKHEWRPRTGAARIAWSARAPIVPAAIKGTDKLLRFGKQRVVYGEPIEATADAQETTERVMDEIYRLYATL
jgi:1-acyl-sn-glycerol-3-phosphate acyltransferase